MSTWAAIYPLFRAFYGSKSTMWVCVRKSVPPQLCRRGESSPINLIPLSRSDELELPTLNADPL